MPVLKRGQHTSVVRQRREHDADVKDLVRRAEQVEPSRREAFWNSVRAARFFHRVVIHGRATEKGSKVIFSRDQSNS